MIKWDDIGWCWASETIMTYEHSGVCACAEETDQSTWEACIYTCGEAGGHLIWQHKSTFDTRESAQAACNEILIPMKRGLE